MEEEEKRKGERKERGKKERKERGKKERKEKEKKKCVEEKKEKRRGKEKIFPMFQRSELDSPRTKVSPRNESYAWVPKSEFFVEASRGRGFLIY